MRGRAQAFLVALVALIPTAFAAPPAMAFAADAPRVVNLRVADAEGEWQPESVFRLDWEQDPSEPYPPVVAVNYQLFDELGAPVGPVARSTDSLRSIERLEVPDRGIYRAEVWLEDWIGRSGPPSVAFLRFDNGRPDPPAALPPSGWIGASEKGELWIEPPSTSPPISGIRGYAISTNGDFPCARAARCTVAETDLPVATGGAVPLGTLPEGEFVAQVATVSGSGVPSASAAATIRVDATRPKVTLEGLPAGWANAPVRLRARSSDELSGMAAAGPAGPFAAIAIDGGGPAITPGNTATATVLGSGVHDVAYYARDAAGNLAVPATAQVRIDEAPPAVEFAAAQDPAEPERIEAFVSDSLSGPSDRRGWIGVRPAGSRGRFQALPTTASDGRLVAIWDSDSFPAGRYEFVATGYDAANNASTGTERVRGGRMVLVNPLKRPAVIESRLQSRKQVVPYGHRVRFAGRLRSATGEALGGRTIAVTETFAPGAEPGQRTTHVGTREDGTFSMLLAAGPNREVVASFAGDRRLTRASGRQTHLEVRSGVALRTSARVARIGGRPVLFSGRVGHRGAPLSRHGRPVELQFRYPGAGWRDFRTVRTDRRGRFRYAYAFSDDDSRGIRFQFRAVVAAEGGWPYEAGRSRPVSVRGG